jgi:hypothetical protein
MRAQVARDWTVWPGGVAQEPLAPAYQRSDLQALRFRRHARGPGFSHIRALPMKPARVRTRPQTSDVQIGHRQRVLLDELATRLDLVAHQRREDIVGSNGVLDLHLHQAA